MYIYFVEKLHLNNKKPTENEIPFVRTFDYTFQLSTISKALLSVCKSLLSTAERKSVLFINETHIRNVDQIASDICDTLF